MELSELLVCDSRQAVQKFHDFSISFHDKIFFHYFPCQDLFPCFSMTVGTLLQKMEGNCGRIISGAPFDQITSYRIEEYCDVSVL